jgi:hypothetical protein
MAVLTRAAMWDMTGPPVLYTLIVAMVCAAKGYPLVVTMADSFFRSSAAA